MYIALSPGRFFSSVLKKKKWPGDAATTYINIIDSMQLVKVARDIYIIFHLYKDCISLIQLFSYVSDMVSITMTTTTDSILLIYRAMLLEMFVGRHYLQHHCTWYLR